MIQLGWLSVSAALGAALFAFVLGIAAFAGRRDDLLAAGRRAVLLCAFFTTLAVVGVEYAFLAGDYQLQYVWSHSDRDMPLLYKIGALWGGMEGSLLFWGWLLSLFSTAAVLRHRKDKVELMGPVVFTVMAVEMLFLGLVVFSESPWKRLSFIPPDGQGLNPLLQHPAMVIHPPCLYLGFVGFTLPFAFAIGALLSRETDSEWLRKSRVWALIAWMFLAAGNVLGGRWAYDELGWGGYWAWDPVENAAFMPWLVGTAFIHSAMIQERKGMLKIWNMLLVITTFLLTIFGTFITRSGLISSVHSFAQSNIGYVFGAFLGVVSIFAFGLLFSRRRELRSDRQFDSFFSRESGFLLNNLILLGGAFAVLWGTIFPMISETLRGVRISVGPPFFNQIMVPLGLVLLGLMGIGPLLTWKRATLVHLRKVATWPVLLGVVAAVVLAVLGISHAYALATFALCAFTASTIVSEFARGIRARRNQTGERPLRAFGQLFRRSPRRFGGYVIHAGVVLVFIGFAGSAFTRTKEWSLTPGGMTEFHGYTLRFQGFRTAEDASVQSVGADILVSRAGKALARLVPKKTWYKKNQQLASEVAIRSNYAEDLYLVLTDYDVGRETASFKAYLNPLVEWYWTGGIVIVLGGLLVLVPWSRSREAGS